MTLAMNEIDDKMMDDRMIWTQTGGWVVFLVANLLQFTCNCNFFKSVLSLARS